MNKIKKINLTILLVIAAIMLPGVAMAQADGGGKKTKKKELTEQTKPARKPQKHTTSERQIETQKTQTPSEMFDKGVKAEQKKNYTEAVRWYRMSALRGHEEAELKLGLMYYKGKYVTQNYQEARIWFLRSRHNPISQFHLGLIYENGYGVSKDYRLAERWYQHAADRGFDMAELALRRVKSKKARDRE